ncbi:hypothetical protein PIN31009_01884 [Pandoraea iniqua]|uniref:hypothetical protein n=1 Tax=Pandoraea iniqua TaxID=2508288 RepID=UPI001242F3FE|nr:hypothetical protein [Pandoraea iniqua]VVD96131.1 hypothetical protein PIN31009_01884 [Pandoraea iniqua]
MQSIPAHLLDRASVVVARDIEIVPPKRIPDQITSAHEAMTALFEALERVSMRVSSIADSAPPETMGEVSAASADPECVIALDSLIERIQLATARAHSIADRVRL